MHREDGLGSKDCCSLTHTLRLRATTLLRVGLGHMDSAVFWTTATLTGALRERKALSQVFTKGKLRPRK